MHYFWASVPMQRPATGHEQGCLRAQDEPAVRAHKKFLQAIADMDTAIARRNADHTNKIRADKAIAYTVLVPHAPSGITSSGIAQSVSY